MINIQLEKIMEEIKGCLNRENEEICQSIIESIIRGKHIFTVGVGRTGFIMRGFAMRLMQAGLESYWIGDTVTPSAEAKDVLVVGSGSGETGTLKHYVETAKEKGLFVILFTTNPNSSLGKQADIVCEIPASSKFKYDEVRSSMQPMGALFEQSLMLVLDALIFEMLEQDIISEETMKKRHANLE